MALRNRNCLQISKAGQENVHVAAKAKALVTDQKTHRAILGELSNRVVSRGDANKKFGVQNGKLPFQEIKKKIVPVKPATKVAVPVKPSVVPKDSKKVDPNEKSSVASHLIPKATKSVTSVKDAYSSHFLNCIDIDKEDGDDPMLVSMYAPDIFAYLRELEVRYPVKPRYLLGQQLTGNMRAVLVDWLVDIHLQFHLLQETLYLTVAILDRFLQRIHNIGRNKFQLVGMAAMWIASKYEEMTSPDITDFVYICDNTFSKQEILQMECTIIKSLDFNLGRPLPPHFLRRYSKAACSEEVVHTMAKYFMELSLLEYEMCHYPPSKIAAAATFLGLWIFGNKDRDVWTSTLIYYSTYTYSDIVPVIRKMVASIVGADTSKHQAVYKKYTRSKFLKVSLCPKLKSPELKMLMIKP